MWRNLLLLLLVLFLARAIMRFMRGVMQGAMGAGAPDRPRRDSAPVGVKMARDPVCGTYVVPGKAIELFRRGEMLYFCSEACREKYRPEA